MTAAKLLPRRAAALAAALLLAAGCGGPDGPEQFPVSGTVTHAGRPVTRGFITFEPDTQKGNTGPGGGAPIADGKYATAPGKGVVGGPVRVRIIGYDGVPAKVNGEEIADGKPLFEPYVTAFEMSRGATQKDFDVPAEAK